VSGWFTTGTKKKKKDSATVSKAYNFEIMSTVTMDDAIELKSNGEYDIYLWQFIFRATKKATLDPTYIYTQDFAKTAGQHQPPKCVPGFCTDGLQCQHCSRAKYEIDPQASAPLI